jgi:hypothetical protein
MHAVVRIVVMAAACAATAGLAQDGKLGAYKGVVSIAGSEIEKHGKIDYKATIKVNLPVTDRSGDLTRAEAGDVEKPSAMATVTSFELEARNASPDSDGKITSWKCSLAAPTDVPMNAQGALDVDHRKKKYSMFVALVGMKAVAMKCVNSRSGAYKDSKQVGFFFGTNPPEAMGSVELPYADPARLVAKHRMTPPGHVVDMEWELQLTK